MKRKIRRSVFETNSSSVHSMTVCTEEDYEKWTWGQVKFDTWFRKFIKTENYSDYNDYDEDDLVNYDGYKRYCIDRDYNYYEEFFTTPSGDKMVAFGYYGHD